MLSAPDFVEQAERFARSMPLGAPPVPVGHGLLGRIGEAIPGRGFRSRGMSWNSIRALLRDEACVRRDPERAARRALRELGAVTTWDGVLSSRANGKADDWMWQKLSQTTVANQWSMFFRSGGFPQAGTVGNIPGGTVYNNASTGALPISTPTGGDKKYLINFGSQHLTGTNVVLLVDLLVGAGNINANLNTLQTVNTSALSRYTGTGSAGNFMTLEVTTAVGATASNVTVTYTNSAGTGSRSSGALAMTASCITFRLQPVTDGQFVPFQAADIGVKSIESIQFSAAMGAGVCALYIYRPLVFQPTIATTTFVERSTAAMLGGLTELVLEAGGAPGCLTPFVLTSTTSTGLQSYFTQMCNG